LATKAVFVRTLCSLDAAASLEQNCVPSLYAVLPIIVVNFRLFLHIIVALFQCLAVTPWEN
jgi:hypothetical protein